MTDLEIQTCAPSDLEETEIQSCISLIENGGAVDSHNLEEEFRQTSLLAIVRQARQIVGLGAIKQKRPYTITIGRRSKFSLDPNNQELGYIVRNEEIKGHRISSKIIKKLVATFKHRPIFATTANKTIKEGLLENGFKQQGLEWKSVHGDDLISLWLKLD